MSKRVVIISETTDISPDGSTTTTKTERVEESTSNGLIEAWAWLTILLFTFLTFVVAYRSINSTRTNQDGIRPTEHFESYTNLN